MALGQLLLTRIDAVMVISVLLAYLFYMWLSRRWNSVHTAFAVTLGLLMIQGAVYIVTLARAYFFDTAFARLQDYAVTALLSMPFLTPRLRHIYLTRPCSRIGLQPCPPVAGMPPPKSADWDFTRITIEILIVLLVIGGLFALRRWGRLSAFELLLRRLARPLFPAMAVGILVLGGYAYMIRPRIMNLAMLGELPNCLALTQLRAPSPTCLAIQGYIGAPIAIPPDIADQRYAIPLANLVRFGWYLSPIGVVLGIIGFALWWRRGVNRSSWLFLVLGLGMSIFWIRQTYGTSDQTYIYILRRYVPLVYPTFCLAIGYALVALARWIRPITNSAALSIAPSLLLVLGLIGFEVGTSWRTIYQHVEYDHALDKIGALAARFSPQDILIFRGGNRPDDGDLVATPLKYAFDRNAITIKSRSPDKYAAPLARYIARWRAQGRQVFLLLGQNGALGLPGFRLERIDQVQLSLQQLEELKSQKPHNIQQFQLGYTIYRLVDGTHSPAVASTVVTVDDYAAQVRGFHRSEQFQSTTAAWTEGNALLRLPWPDPAAVRSITLQLAGGKRPAALGPAHVCLSFRPELSFWLDDPAFSQEHGQFSPLGCFDLDESLRSYTVMLDPRSRPPSNTGTLLLRIESPSWIPAEHDSSQPDQRTLGVLFGGLRLFND